MNTRDTVRIAESPKGSTASALYPGRLVCWCVTPIRLTSRGQQLLEFVLQSRPSPERMTFNTFDRALLVKVVSLSL
jgi:hypothetical protein